jgi:hypothetical protein
MVQHWFRITICATVATVAVPVAHGAAKTAAKAAATAYKPGTQPKKPAAGGVQQQSFTLNQARAVAKDPAATKKYTKNVLARALYILQKEGTPAEATAFANALKAAAAVNAKVMEEVAFYKQSYDVPCSSKPARVDTAWPPKYQCNDAPKAAAGPRLEPTGFIHLKANPKLVWPKGDAESPKKEPVKDDKALLEARLKQLEQRDAFVLASEKLAAPPREFCYQNKCFPNHAGVAKAIYGAQPGADKLPVFCAPKVIAGKWSIDKAYCTSDWAETLNWKPYVAGGQPNKPAEKGVIPPWACFGAPHLTSEHMVLPATANSQATGFFCRKRVYRVLAQKAPQSLDDVYKNIAQLCTEMRQQTWGEKYKNINAHYEKWCRGPQGPKNKNLCPKGFLKPAGSKAGDPPMPWMYLTREEILFYYGHQEYFCRADRPGLTHFLWNAKWADTFTCGIDRGLVEAGPFEEGVQVCAVSPYYHRDKPQIRLKDPFKARFHCWQFNRPSCEEVSLPKTEEEEKRFLFRSQLFDAYDALREYRRTRTFKVLGLFDLKDAEKVSSFAEQMSYSDNAKDEGTFGIKDFCRFVGNLKTIQCGYTKDSIARYYELRKHESPRNCTAVCERGAYQQGYFCAVFQTPEMFKGKPYWMCGINNNFAGRAIIDSSPAMCVGGKLVETFQSSRGDKSTLQCYERRFKWAESEKSKALLEELNWVELLERADKALSGEKIKEKWAELQTDKKQFIEWAKQYGHTFGHRTSMRVGLIRKDSPLDLVKKFFALKFSTDGKPGTIKLDWIEDGKPATDKAKSDKAKDLNELVDEIKNGDRAPDEKWYHAFMGESKEDGKPVMAKPHDVHGPNSPTGLVTRMYRLFDLFGVARELILKFSHEYAKAVFEHAKTLKKTLTRTEVHDRARSEVFNKQNIQGNLYCVPEPLSDSDEESGEQVAKRPYVCASSAFLAAGMVEYQIKRKSNLDKFAPGDDATPADHPRLYEEFLQQSRTQVKSEWCYGGTKGGLAYGPNPSPSLYGLNLSSPFLLEAPAGVLDKESQMLNPTKPFTWKNKINWLKCSGFQYSDENWKRFVPKRGKDAPSAAEQAKGGGGGGGNDRAGEIANAALKFVFELLKLVGPDFKKAIEIIENMKDAALEFIDKWADKFGEAAKEQWDKTKEVEDKKRDEVKEAKEALETQRSDSRKAQDDARQKFDEAVKAAEEAYKTATEEATKAHDEAVAAATKEWDETKTAAKEALDKTKDASIDPIDKARETLEAAKVEAAAAVGTPAAKDKKEKETAAKAALEEVKSEWKEKIAEARKTLSSTIAEADKKKKEALQAAAQAKKEAFQKAKQEQKDAIKKATDELKEEVKKQDQLIAEKVKALKAKETELKQTLDQNKKDNMTLKKSAELIAAMIKDITETITNRVAEAVKPKAGELFKKGFGFVRKLLGIVFKAILGVVASIPFVGGALSTALAVAFDFGMDALEQFAFEKLFELLKELFAKVVGATVQAGIEPLKKQLVKVLHSRCMARGPEICPPEAGKMQFAKLPPKYQWLERGMACKWKPRFPDSMYDDALAARQNMIRIAERLKKNAVVYAKAFANRYLARYGLSYDTWMAAVGTESRSWVLAKKTEIEEQMKRETSRLQKEFGLEMLGLRRREGAGAAQ